MGSYRNSRFTKSILGQLKKKAVGETNDIAKEYLHWSRGEGVSKPTLSSLRSWVMDRYPDKSDENYVTKIWGEISPKIANKKAYMLPSDDVELKTQNDVIKYVQRFTKYLGDILSKPFVVKYMGKEYYAKSAKELVQELAKNVQVSVAANIKIDEKSIRKADGGTYGDPVIYMNESISGIEDTGEEKDIGFGEGSSTIDEQNAQVKVDAKPEVKTELTGIGRHNDMPDDKFDSNQLAMGIKVEKEHTDNVEMAKSIAKDHLSEISDYYTRLATMEADNKPNGGTANPAIGDAKPEVPGSFSEPSKIDSEHMIEPGGGGVSNGNEPGKYANKKIAGKISPEQLSKLYSEVMAAHPDPLNATTVMTDRLIKEFKLSPDEIREQVIPQMDMLKNIWEQTHKGSKVKQPLKEVASEEIKIGDVIEVTWEDGSNYGKVIAVNPDYAGPGKHQYLYDYKGKTHSAVIGEEKIEKVANNLEWFKQFKVGDEVEALRDIGSTAKKGDIGKVIQLELKTNGVYVQFGPNAIGCLEGEIKKTVANKIAFDFSFLQGVTSLHNLEILKQIAQIILSSSIASGITLPLTLLAEIMDDEGIRPKDFIEQPVETIKIIVKNIPEYATSPLASKKIAEDIIPSAPATKFKEQKSKPDLLDMEKVVPAPVEVAHVVDEMKNAQSRLAAIKASIDKLNAQYEIEKKKTESEGGKIENEAQFNNLVNSLAAMLERAQLETVRVGDEYITLKNETKDVKFAPSYKWKMDKLLDKFGKDAEIYLEKAIAGAQNMGTEEQVREIIMFPAKGKNASVNKQAQLGLADQIKDVYNNLKNYVIELFNLDKEMEAIKIKE